MAKIKYQTLSEFERLAYAGKGQHKITQGNTTPAGVNYYCLYATSELTINYDSALEGTNGDASISGIDVAKGDVYYGVMTNIEAVSGGFVANIL